MPPATSIPLPVTAHSTRWCPKILVGVVLICLLGLLFECPTSTIRQAKVQVEGDVASLTASPRGGISRSVGLWRSCWWGNRLDQRPSGVAPTTDHRLAEETQFASSGYSRNNSSPVTTASMDPAAPVRHPRQPPMTGCPPAAVPQGQGEGEDFGERLRFRTLREMTRLHASRTADDWDALLLGHAVKSVNPRGDSRNRRSTTSSSSGPSSSATTSSHRQTTLSDEVVAMVRDSKCQGSSANQQFEANRSNSEAPSSHMTAVWSPTPGSCLISASFEASDYDKLVAALRRDPTGGCASIDDVIQTACRCALQVAGVAKLSDALDETGEAAKDDASGATAAAAPVVLRRLAVCRLLTRRCGLHTRGTWTVPLPLPALDDEATSPSTPRRPSGGADGSRRFDDGTEEPGDGGRHPATVDGAADDFFISRRAMLRALLRATDEGRHPVLFSGDSTVRQMFFRLVNFFRGERESMDYLVWGDSAYVIHDSGDELILSPRRDKWESAVHAPAVFSPSLLRATGVWKSITDKYRTKGKRRGWTHAAGGEQGAARRSNTSIGLGGPEGLDVVSQDALSQDDAKDAAPFVASRLPPTPPESNRSSSRHHVAGGGRGDDSEELPPAATRRRPVAVLFIVFLWNPWMDLSELAPVLAQVQPSLTLNSFGMWRLKRDRGWRITHKSLADHRQAVEHYHARAVTAPSASAPTGHPVASLPPSQRPRRGAAVDWVNRRESGHRRHFHVEVGPHLSPRSRAAEFEPQLAWSVRDSMKQWAGDDADEREGRSLCNWGRAGGGPEVTCDYLDGPVGTRSAFQTTLPRKKGPPSSSSPWKAWLDVEQLIRRVITEPPWRPATVNTTTTRMLSTSPPPRLRPDDDDFVDPLSEAASDTDTIIAMPLCLTQEEREGNATERRRALRLRRDADNRLVAPAKNLTFALRFQSRTLWEKDCAAAPPLLSRMTTTNYWARHATLVSHDWHHLGCSFRPSPRRMWAYLAAHGRRGGGVRRGTAAAALPSLADTALSLSAVGCQDPINLLIVFLAANAAADAAIH